MKKLFLITYTKEQYGKVSQKQYQVPAKNRDTAMMIFGSTFHLSVEEEMIEIISVDEVK